MDNTHLLSTFLVFCLLHGANLQQFTNSNFGLESDADYQEYQPAPKSISRPQILPKATRPRIPEIETSQSKATPVPILKQINRHNEDGSYTYGFEGADGSFKIETKAATGEVVGKYGYVDDNGKVRVVEYGANKYGFQPSGEGITIPSINISNDTDPQEYEEPTPKPATVPKRKQKPIPYQEPRPVVPYQEPKPVYYVQEQDELPRPSEPIDVNSIIVNDMQDQRPKPQKTVFLPQEESSPPPRSLPQGFVIPKIFEDPSSFNQLQSQLEPIQKPRIQQRPKPVYFSPSISDSPAVRRTSPESKSILDELLKQYTVPNGSPAINDFSYTYNL